MKERRRKHIWWEYNGDGQFRKERLGQFWKRYWNKYFRKNAKKDLVESR